MTRSKYIKRKYRFFAFVKQLREWMFNTSVLLVLLAVCLLTWRAFNLPVRINANLETVAAFRIPTQTMEQLYALSHIHDIPFSRLLTLYSLENDFSPEVVHPDSLELYAIQFNQLRRKFHAGDVRMYHDMFHSVLGEIQYFPIPMEYQGTYMYSDSWGSHRGTAIVDRENIRGRLPVVSMTDGHILHAGWHVQHGYHVIIVTENGNRYLYAHLNSIDDYVNQGNAIQAGQALGTMGATGDASPVHLHIGISPNVSFAMDFWINPYPLLQHISNRQNLY